MNEECCQKAFFVHQTFECIDWARHKEKIAEKYPNRKNRIQIGGEEYASATCMAEVCVLDRLVFERFPTALSFVRPNTIHELGEHPGVVIRHFSFGDHPTEVFFVTENMRFRVAISCEICGKIADFVMGRQSGGLICKECAERLGTLFILGKFLIWRNNTRPMRPKFAKPD